MEHPENDLAVGAGELLLTTSQGATSLHFTSLHFTLPADSGSYKILTSYACRCKFTPLLKSNVNLEFFRFLLRQHKKRGFRFLGMLAQFASEGEFVQLRLTLLLT